MSVKALMSVGRTLEILGCTLRTINFAILVQSGSSQYSMRQNVAGVVQLSHRCHHVKISLPK